MTTNTWSQRGVAHDALSAWHHLERPCPTTPTERLYELLGSSVREEELAVEGGGDTPHLEEQEANEDRLGVHKPKCSKGAPRGRHITVANKVEQRQDLT